MGGQSFPGPYLSLGESGVEGKDGAIRSVTARLRDRKGENGASLCGISGSVHAVDTRVKWTVAMTC